ncbi:MAG: hypothetical protein HOE25_05695, partial [Flavobacteriales bacterium]|nr:hypothetical protein [Flavobacteriales bacterium]
MKTIYKTNPKRILGYLMAFAMVFFTTNVTGQCTNSSSYGSGIAPTSGTNTISTCNYLSEKSTISGVVAGATYTNNIQIGGATVGYVTIVEGNGITHHGPAPLTWTADTSGSVTGHWNVDASCATAFGCHTTTIMYGAPVPGCTDPIATNYNSLA